MLPGGHDVRLLAAALERVNAEAQHVGLDLRRLDAPEERELRPNACVASARNAL